MPYFVNISQSEKDSSYYNGFTTQPRHRLLEHNAGECTYTSRKLPWKMVYLEQLSSKTEALKRERSLKRSNQEYLQWLIANSGKNIVREMDM